MSIEKVKLVVFDVDGVLTDGSIMLDDNGVETKRFNVRDGQGIAAWLQLGLEVAIITRRAGQKKPCDVMAAPAASLGDG